MDKHITSTGNELLPPLAHDFRATTFRWLIPIFDGVMSMTCPNTDHAAFVSTEDYHFL